jgi:1-piperideine-2-carboxylate/1-pyrroline-2-carboxylate reductase [NAD(P)H]
MYSGGRFGIGITRVSLKKIEHSGFIIREKLRMPEHFSAAQTAALLPFPMLVNELERAAQQYAAGLIVSPPRLGVPFSHGTLLSMPAVADDMVVHKLITVCPGNAALGLPTITGTVTAYAARTGQPSFVLDGPTVTGRRTAAISMLAVTALGACPPRAMLLVGTGRQSSYHVEAIAAMFPAARVVVQGTTAARATQFCQQFRDLPCAPVPLDPQAAPLDYDVVITLTTSKSPVYSEPAKRSRLIVAVGAFTPDAAEIDPDTVHASQLYVDDLAGATHEAGDLIQANVAWDQVRTLHAALLAASTEPRPVLFKSVGCGAWDLAACRTAATNLGARLQA